MSLSPCRTVLVLLAAAANLAGCASREAVESPVWTGDRPPPGGQSYTPERAFREDVAGRVMLRCRSSAKDGSISDCQVVFESPRNWGFGAAALRVAASGNIDVRKSTLGPVTPDGLVDVPVYFCPADPPCNLPAGPGGPIPPQND